MRGILKFRRNPRITPWVSVATPTIFGVTADPTKPSAVDVDILYWRRVGSFMEVRYHFAASNATGAAAGTGAYYWDVPGGHEIDTNVLDLPAGAASEVVKAFTTNLGFACGEGDGGGGVETLTGKPYARTSTTWGLTLGNSRGAAQEFLQEVASYNYSVNLVPVRYHAMLFLPISGWKETR